VKPPFESWKRPVPRHPYRDTVILYGSLAALALVIAALTGVSMVKAVIFTAIAFVGGTIYSCWYWRDRLRERREEEQP
jgi:quinol-cytochrome oxidoreductase complex cytochrome b subunit